ncbi:hypothetical protein M569_06138, partial [Genlisea aurea]
MASSSSSSQPFNSQMTLYVLVSWAFAAFGGLMFGYDVGISGGVTAMDDFLEKFFPRVYQRKLVAKENNYCKYNDQYLQLFTSSLYLAALVASFGASKACTILGRRLTIRLASILFIVAAVVSGSAPNLFLLIIGRILFGIGVGFGNESVPLFLSEVAPVQYRGGVNILFQLLVTVGILVANIINYFVSTVHPYGWRIALGLAVIPAVVLFIGSFIITDTPPSLLERGKEADAKSTLRKIRGVENVDEEFEQIREASEIAKRVKNPYRNLLKKSSFPMLFISVIIQIFQQFTGINAVMFYAPVLFQTVGFRNDGSLLSAVITGTINVVSTLIAVAAVDRFGRRKLLLQASVQMFL